MKRRTEKGNMKLIGLASTLGAAAIAVSVVAASNAARRNTLPTDSGSNYVYTYSSSSDVPVQNSVPNVPIGSSSKSSEKSQPSEEVNKPVTVEMGNIMPVEGEVSHPFSNGELVKSETLGVWKTHDGCDILCDVGTDVKSMSEGVVKMIDSSTIWGVCVTIEQTNGLEVQYCGLAKELNVKAGTMVKQGEIIGKTGETNEAEMLQKPHLHLAVKQNGSWIDPMSVIGD
ncbi:MAG: peptidoglycan DD-metalloendopeptidase family protein [Oscillospiraceae bacterium]